MISRSLSILLLGVLFSLGSCSEGGFLAKNNEGTIIYDVTFPYEQNTLLLELYPKEMIFDFNRNFMRASLQSAWGVITTDVIVDNSQKSYSQLFKSFGDKYSLTLQDNEVRDWYAQKPSLKFTETGDTATIAGFLCNKVIADFSNDSLPSIEVYYTKEIQVDQTNWWNQFEGIDGFLMSYEIEQYGKRMKLVAREVEFTAIAPEKFVMPEGYVALDTESMDKQITRVVTEFMGP